MSKITFTKNDEGGTDIAFEGNDKDWGTGWPRCERDYLDIFKEFRAPPENLSVTEYVARLTEEEQAHFECHFKLTEKLREDGHVDCEKGDWLAANPEKAALFWETLKQPRRPIPTANVISSFIHCGKCMKRKPSNVSPAEWARLNIGWTKIGLQVWCVRCNHNLLHIDFGDRVMAARSGPDESN